MAEQVLDEEEFIALMGSELAKEPDASRAEVLRDSLVNKTWAELEVVERGDRLLFPEKLWKRAKDGRFVVTPIMVQVPNTAEMRLARVMAHRIAAEDGIDPRRDPVEFENLENVCILAWAVRSPTAPYEFLYAATKDEPDARMLERRFDEGSLAHLGAKLAPYKEMLDPKLARLSREEFVAVLSSIAERRDIAPLRAIDGPAQRSFIVTTASLLHGLMTRQPSSPSSESSTPGPSSSGISTSSSAEDGSGGSP